MLRKQARKLENDIDIKLVAYSKVGSSSMPTTSVDTAPLLGEHVFDSLSMEIEQMMDKVCAFRLRFNTNEVNSSVSLTVIRYQ